MAWPPPLSLVGPPYRLRESVIKTPQGKIKFRQSGKLQHFHIGVWLDSASTVDRDAVASVEYLLHPTFRNRTRRSANRSNDFSITFWAWGAFKIEATIHFVDPDRAPETIEHQIDIRLPEDTGDNYEQVD